MPPRATLLLVHPAGWKEMLSRERWDVGEHAPLTIGRAPENALSVGHVYVSREHAQIRYDHHRGHILLKDVGSKRGTFLGRRAGLDARPLAAPEGGLTPHVEYELFDADVVYLGPRPGTPDAIDQDGQRVPHLSFLVLIPAPPPSGRGACR